MIEYKKVIGQKMKKRLSTLLIITGILISVYAEGTKFTDAFRNCTPFRDTGSVNMLDTTVQSRKNIKGWDGDRCVYNENVSFMGIESNVVCKFTKPQLEEIASVVDAYELVQQYSGTTPDFSSIDSAQNNPVSKVWSKYMQDSSICTITTNQQ